MAKSSHNSLAYNCDKSKMATNGKWEVVGKGGKKRASNEGKKNKVKASDMPKADISSKSINCVFFQGFSEQTRS